MSELELLIVSLIRWKAIVDTNLDNRKASRNAIGPHDTSVVPLQMLWVSAQMQRTSVPRSVAALRFAHGLE